MEGKLWLAHRTSRLRLQSGIKEFPAIYTMIHEGMEEVLLHIYRRGNTPTYPMDIETVLIQEDIKADMDYVLNEAVGRGLLESDDGCYKLTSEGISECRRIRRSSAASASGPDEPYTIKDLAQYLYFSGPVHPRQPVNYGIGEEIIAEAVSREIAAIDSSGQLTLRSGKRRKAKNEPAGKGHLISGNGNAGGMKKPAILAAGKLQSMEEETSLIRRIREYASSHEIFTPDELIRHLSGGNTMDKDEKMPVYCERRKNASDPLGRR